MVEVAVLTRYRHVQPDCLFINISQWSSETVDTLECPAPPRSLGFSAQINVAV